MPNLLSHQRLNISSMNDLSVRRHALDRIRTASTENL